MVAGAGLGIWVVSAWSFHTIHFWPTGYASSSVPRISLRIHHNRLGSMEVIAIPLVCCLSDLSASRAHAVVCSLLLIRAVSRSAKFGDEELEHLASMLGIKQRLGSGHRLHLL